MALPGGYWISPPIMPRPPASQAPKLPYDKAGTLGFLHSGGLSQASRTVGYVDVRAPCVGQVRPGLPRRVIRCPSLQVQSLSGNLHRLGGTVSTVLALIFSVRLLFLWCLLPMAWRGISTSQAKSEPLPAPENSASASFSFLAPT